MKRFLAAILVLAMAMALVPAVAAADEAVVLVDVADQSVTANSPYVYEGVADTAGILTVTPSGDPGWGFKVSVGDAEGIMQSGSFADYDWELAEGDAYKVEVYAYSNWSTVTGTVGLVLTFTPSEGAATQKAEHVFDSASSAAPLKVGTYELTLDDSAYYTLYTFTPDEIGVYTFTVNEGATIGYWGAGAFYVKNPGSTEASIEKEIKSVGNSAVLGITSEDPNVTLTIEKTGESEGLVETVYVDWTNVHTPSADLAGTPADVELVDIDITQSYTTVLGEDGYYHLDSANGPVIYVDLKGAEFDLNLAFGSYGALTMRGEYNGTNYDFKPAMSAYNTAITGTDGVYPVTEDLYAFLHGYGNGAGLWYTPALSCFEEIQSGNFNADSAWMVMCAYAPVVEPVEENLVLNPGENAVTLQPGVNYTLRLVTTGLTLADCEMTWNANVTVTADGVEVTSPYSLAGFTRRVVLVATVAEETAVTFKLAAIPEEVIPDGLYKGEDDNYYYYVNGEVATDFTGLVDNAVGSWYILNGMAQMSYDGVIEYEGTKYLIKAGHVNTEYTDLYRIDGGRWLYFVNGVQDVAYKGLISRLGMKGYVENGEVNFNKTAIVEDEGVLVYVKYGIWRDTFVGLARQDDGNWLYMVNGTFDPSYTGVAKLNSLWVYVSDGCANFNYSGIYNVDGVDYTIQYGVVQF